MRLAGRVRRLETAGGDTRKARHVAAFLAALRVFGGGSGEAGAYGPGQPTTMAGLLAVLRTGGDGQREGGNDATTHPA